MKLTDTTCLVYLTLLPHFLIEILPIYCDRIVTSLCFQHAHRPQRTHTHKISEECCIKRMLFTFHNKEYIDLENIFVPVLKEFASSGKQKELTFMSTANLQHLPQISSICCDTLETRRRKMKSRRWCVHFRGCMHKKELHI